MKYFHQLTTNVKLITISLLLSCMFQSFGQESRQQVRLPTETGLASWYGVEHQGKRMANGQPFDRMKFTAASRTLPLGAVIAVTCVPTQQTADVTITDRGPWKSTRILDLAEAPARAIGCAARGVFKITIQTPHHEELSNEDYPNPRPNTLRLLAPRIRGVRPQRYSRCRVAPRSGNVRDTDPRAGDRHDGR